MGNNNGGSNTQNNTGTVTTGETPKVTIISDKRCGAKCDTTELMGKLKEIPSLATAEITQMDYSDDAAKKVLKSAGINTLPAAIFSNNSVSELANFLKATTDFKYSLELGSTYDPTVKRSDKGFIVLDKKILEEIKKDSYVKGNKDAAITWIEYSDLECPYCAKLHNSGTPEELTKKYGDKLNQVFQSFPLGFHKNALPGAEAIECLGKQKGGKAYYSLIKTSFKEENSKLSFLIDEAVKLGADKASLETCIENKTFSAKINKQQQAGTKEFGVTGTPGNVLINNATGEYEVISGAYPTASFEEIIDRLLK